jgi:hypothetical protein
LAWLVQVDSQVQSVVLLTASVALAVAAAELRVLPSVALVVQVAQVTLLALPVLQLAQELLLEQLEQLELLIPEVAVAVAAAEQLAQVRGALGESVALESSLLKSSVSYHISCNRSRSHGRRN